MLLVSFDAKVLLSGPQWVIVNMAKRKPVLAVRLNDELYTRVVDLAKAQFRSPSSLIAENLADLMAEGRLELPARGVREAQDETGVAS